MRIAAGESVLLRFFYREMLARTLFAGQKLWINVTVDLTGAKLGHTGSKREHTVMHAGITQYILFVYIILFDLDSHIFVTPYDRLAPLYSFCEGNYNHYGKILQIRYAVAIFRICAKWSKLICRRFHNTFVAKQGKRVCKRLFIDAREKTII